MKHTSVYIVDDSLTIRAMMQSLVERNAAFDICGLAADVDHALDEIATLRPDIVLLDLALRGRHGFAFLDGAQEQIRDPWNAMKVIVVSSSAKRDAAVCAQAFEYGAVACFDKSCLCSQSRAFLTLLRDVSRDRVRPDQYAGSAVTLPEANDDSCDFMPPSPSPRLPNALTFI